MPRILHVKIKTSSKGDVTFSELKKQYRDLSRKHVTVGILEPGRAYPNTEATVGEVALWQEFGTRPKNGRAIPSRSFLRTPFDKSTDAIFRLKTKLLAQIAADKITVVQGLQFLGADLVRRMQTAIKKRIPPPLRPYTLERRKEKKISGTIPLYATGFLYNSIHFAVRDSGQDK